MQFAPSSLTLRTSRRRTPLQMIAAALLLGVALAGCKTNPAGMYKAGFDKSLTESSWAARAPDEAVVIIGGYPSVWQKSDDKNYAFEARLRFKVGWFGGYDVALVKAGTYQLATLVGAGGGVADFGGFNWGTVGAAPSSEIANFEVGPGEVIYVGNLDALIRVEDLGSCWANFSVSNSSLHVVPSFAMEVPYVKAVPKTVLLKLEQNAVRFPCGM